MYNVRVHVTGTILSSHGKKEERAERKEKNYFCRLTRRVGSDGLLCPGRPLGTLTTTI